MACWFFLIYIVLEIDTVKNSLNNLVGRNFKKNKIIKIEDVFDRCLESSKIIFYIGKTSSETLKLILENKYTKSKQIDFYIHPASLEFIDIKFLSFNNINIYITDTPIHSIAKFDFKNDKCESLEIIRKNKNDNCFCSIELSEDDELINSYVATYQSFYAQESIFLQNKSLFLFLKCFWKNYYADKKCIYQHNKINLKSRVTFFHYGCMLTEKAQESLLAIDFINPDIWNNDFHLSKYVDAHKVKIPSKKRIHIYDEKKICNYKDDYLKFIELMKSSGVELLFLNINKFDFSKYEGRGSLIVDNLCVLIAVNPGVGIMFGEIDFNASVVSNYLNRFNDLLGSAINTNDFLKKLN